MPCQIIHWQGIQTNFVTICTKAIFIKVVLGKLEQERASWYMYAISQPLSRKQAIFTAVKRQCVTEGHITFVKANGAEDKPKVNTMDRKYIVAP